MRQTFTATNFVILTDGERGSSAWHLHLDEHQHARETAARLQLHAEGAHDHLRKNVK